MTPRARLLLVLLLLPAALRAGRGGEFRAYRGEVAGSYDYWFLDPEDGRHMEGAHYPLLIFLHGASLCGRNLDKVRRYGPINAVARGASIDSYILAPQNGGGAWDPAKIMRIVDWAASRFAVDTTRVYVYGMSLGGYGTLDLAAAYPDRVAAAMALCGGASARDLSGLSRVPLWIIHGTADRAVRIVESERVVRAIRATGDDSRLIFTPLKGVDHGRPARAFYMRITYDWLFSHSTRDPGREVCRDFEITPALLDKAYQDLSDGAPVDVEEYR